MPCGKGIPHGISSITGVPLQGAHIGGAQLAAVAGVGLDVEGDLLALVEGFKAIGFDGRKMHKNILAAVIVGYKAIALIRIKPFYSTVIHLNDLQIDSYNFPVQRKITYVVNHLERANDLQHK